MSKTDFDYKFKNTYELAKWIVDFEFFRPESKHMNREKLIAEYEKKLDDFIEYRVADSIIGMLVSKIHKDETTDPSGYTITKRAVEKHAGQVMQNIKRGALHSVKLKGSYFYEQM